MSPQIKKQIEQEIDGIVCTKNFRSATAEEWFVFLPNFKEAKTGGAAGKVFVHYDLQGNKDVFINTTIIYEDKELYCETMYQLVYAISEELVNRLVGYANTLLSVHAGDNSYQSEYINKKD